TLEVNKHAFFADGSGVDREVGMLIDLQCLRWSARIASAVANEAWDGRAQGHSPEVPDQRKLESLQILPGRHDPRCLTFPDLLLGNQNGEPPHQGFRTE